MERTTETLTETRAAVTVVAAALVIPAAAALDVCVAVEEGTAPVAVSVAVANSFAAADPLALQLSGLLPQQLLLTHPFGVPYYSSIIKGERGCRRPCRGR